MDLDVSKFSYKISFTDLRRVGFKLDSGKVFEAVKGDARLVALQLLMETSRKAKHQYFLIPDFLFSIQVLLIEKVTNFHNSLSNFQNNGLSSVALVILIVWLL